MPFPNLDGRPSEYTEDVPQKVIDYLNDRITNRKPISRAGCAVYLGVSKKTMLTWEKEHKQLLHALEMLDSLQELDIIDNSLMGKYNSNIAKLLLSNHGYSDKQEVKSENTNVNLNEDITDNDPEKRLQEVLKKIKDLQQE